MRTKNFGFRVIYLLTIIVLSYNAFGHGVDKHVKDMCDVYPFNGTNGKNAVVGEFYRLVCSYLDYSNFPSIYYGKVGNPDFISTYQCFYNMTFSNHRIWYHWGFNGDPHKYQQLIDVVNRNVIEGKLAEDDVDFFWQCLEDDISNRNRKLMQDAATIMGYKGIQGPQRKQINAFVAILYDIHILGDYQTTETDLLIDKRSLYNDLYKAIEELSGADKSAIKRSSFNTLKKQLVPFENNPDAYLKKLAELFTPFLYSLDKSLGIGYDYKTKFTNMGYIMK